MLTMMQCVSRLAMRCHSNRLRLVHVDFSQLRKACTHAAWPESAARAKCASITTIIADKHTIEISVRVQGQLGRLSDNNQKPPGLLGWWPAGAVTFLDNHDTGAPCAHTFHRVTDG